MSFRTATLLLAAVLLPAAPAHAAPAYPVIPAPQVDLPLMKDTVKTLSSDAFEGRGPMTRAEPKVLADLVRRFKAAGLQPGNKGSWLQAVPTVGMTAAHHSPLAITGGNAPLSFAYGSDFVAGSYRFVPKTTIARLPLVFVGYGINAPELGWNDYAGLDMKGKIAVVLINDPDYASPTEEGLFKGRRMTYYGRWIYKFEEAARQGAAGILIVHDTFPAAYGWNVIQSSWSGEQYFVDRGNGGMDQPMVNGWVQLPVAEKIFASAGKNFASLREAAGHKGFRAVPLGVSASLTFDSAVRRATSHNVIGVLPGKTRPNDVVLYTAHWDHLGHCKADAKGDDICNGAIDNGTGLAALVALAEANHKAGPAARSQAFVAVTLEESGLLGSEWYAQHPVFPLVRTVGGVNMDALRAGGRARDYTLTGGDKSELADLVAATLARDGLTISPEAHPERGSYYRSDHFSLAKRGVPMVEMGRGLDWFVGGREAGNAANEDYVAHRYHQPSDEYSPDWNWDGIVEDVQVFYQLGRALAQSSAWPNWRPTDEFRRVRDTACAAARAPCAR